MNDDPDAWREEQIATADELGYIAGTLGSPAKMNPYLDGGREAWLAKYWEESRQTALRDQHDS